MKSIRIFISSPGDVAQEREICRRVMGRLNREFAGRADLDGYFWEYEPMIITQDYQEQIPAPSSFDIFVCILWSRLGSRLHSKYRLPDGRPCRSGTEFEFVDAVEGRERTQGTPDILVWVNKTQPLIPLEPEREYEQRISQWRALKEFLAEWTRDDDEAVFKGAVNSYRRLDQFEELIEVKLRKLVQRRLQGEVSDQAAARKPQWAKGSPYRGLRTFREEHAEVYFGRTAAIESVLSAVRRQGEAGLGFVLLLGASGSGKSSLAYAGCLPLLTTPGVIERIGLWRQASFRPGSEASDLFANFAEALLDEKALPEMADPECDDPIAELADRLAQKPGMVAERVRLVLNEAARRHCDAQRHQMAERAEELRSSGRGDDADAITKRMADLHLPRARLLLVLDQLEELFTGNASAEQRSQFVEVIDSLGRSGRVVILATLRSDFYHRCQELPKLIALMGEAGKLDLLPPQPHEIGQIIREPARMAGLSFEKDPATGESLDEIVRDDAVAHPNALPLLEHCLDQLYACQAERGDYTLRFKDYERIGKLEGALARHAESVFSLLEPDAQGAFDPVFRALVTLGREERLAVRRTTLCANLYTVPGARSLVERFTDQRLFTTDQNASGEPTVAVAHEALLREWDRVREWIRSNEDFLAVRARVAEAHGRWKQSAQDPSFLLQAGRQLAEAEEGVAGYGAAFSPGEREFVSLSRGRIDAVETRAKTRRRRVMAVMAVLTGLSVIGFILAEHLRRQQKETAERESRALSRAEVTLAAGTNFLTDVLGGETFWMRRLLDKDVLLSGEFLQAADAFIEGLSRDNPPIALLEHRMRAMANLAFSHYRSGDGKAAVAAQKRALAWQEELIGLEPDRVAYQKELGTNHFLLGLYHSLARDQGAAEDSYRLGLSALAPYLDGGSLGDLAPAWLQLKAALADKVTLFGSAEEGRSLFREALVRIEEWAKQAPEIDWHVEIVKLSLKEAEAYRKKEWYEEEADALTRAEISYGEMGEESSSAPLALEIARGWAEHLYHKEEWEACIQKFQAIMEQLPPDDEAASTQDQLERSDLLKILVKAQRNAGQNAEAYDSAYHWSGICQDLVELDPNNFEYGAGYAEALRALAEASLALEGKEREAAGWFAAAAYQLLDLLDQKRVLGLAERLIEDTIRAFQLHSGQNEIDAAFQLLERASGDHLEDMADAAASAAENDADNARRLNTSLAYLQAMFGAHIWERPERRMEGLNHIRAAVERFERANEAPAPAEWKQWLEESDAEAEEEVEPLPRDSSPENP